MRIVKRLLPVILITAFIAVMSFYLYSEMLGHEKQKCWQELSEAAEHEKEEIQTKFQDEITKLRLLEAVILQHDDFGMEDYQAQKLAMAQTEALFSRIDLLFPDGSIMTDGEVRSCSAEIDFDAIAAAGEYISERMDDYITGKPGVYYVMPIEKGDQLAAVLLGVVESERLREIFRPTIYGGNAEMCIIDSQEGSYIMDSWHKQLGNAYEDTDRNMLEGYREVDLQQGLRNLETNMAAFESHTTGRPIYMYYTPLDMFDWQLSIFVEEGVLFAELTYFRRLLLAAGGVEALALALYFLWNVGVLRRLEKSLAETQEQRQRLRELSYLDMLTGIFNRNKYMESLAALQKERLEHVGAAYLDLNGLKQINDTQMHEAGDAFIRSAADAIAGEFPGSCYRVGGDEFVVLAREIGRGEFFARLDALQREMDQRGISTSVGSAWAQECESLNALLKEAEEQMYSQKASYYMTHDRRSGAQDQA